MRILILFFSLAAAMPNDAAPASVPGGVSLGLRGGVLPTRINPATRV